VTLIIAVVTALRQRRESLELQKTADEAALRSQAERFSCWVSGRINSPAAKFGVKPGDLVVTLMNASEQPFTEAVVEVGLKEAYGPASIHRFKISAVPPGMSWFAFDSSGKAPETLLLPIWFVDRGSLAWKRSPYAGLIWIRPKEQLSNEGQGAAHASLHHGDPAAALELDDAWA
jgi:hypothetical protein